MIRKFKFIFCLAYITSLTAFGQSGFTLSIPAIYSKVEVPNNWSPPTAINRENQFKGTAIGYGANLNYSFFPSFLTRNKHILLNIGVGYIKQRFDIVRPFDFVAPSKPIFYTDNYSYYSWQWSTGLTYNYSFRKNYYFSCNLSYSLLNSFRQEYILLYTYLGSDHSQVNYNQINFGNTLMLAIGLNRNLRSRFSVGLNVLVPLYTRWRNDKIFKDDPTEFSHPKFSLGFNISVAYYLRNNHKP